MPNVFALFLCVTSLDTNIWDDVVLSRWNAIVAHDSATGYFQGSSIVAKFVKTQATNWAGQLECGARAFDVRIGPITTEGLVFHHGLFTIHYLFDTALNETLQWASAHPGELIVLIVAEPVAENNRTTDDTISEYKRILALHEVPFIGDCAKFPTLTVGNARRLARRSYGVIAVDATCVDGHFDESVHCSEVSVHQSYCCYKLHPEVAFGKLWQSLEFATRKYPPSLGYAEAHWQYDPESVAASEVFGGSVLLDETYAAVNKKLIGRLDTFKALSWLEVDNVCDAGKELFNALNRRHESLRSNQTARYDGLAQEQLY